MPILSNPVAAMHRDYPGCEIEYLDLGQPCPLEHRRERRLGGVPADRLGQVTVGGGISHDAFSQPGQHLERVQVIGLLERLPDLRKFEHQQPPAWFQAEHHYSERGVLARHVAQAEADSDAVEIACCEWQPLGVALHGRGESAGIEQAVSSPLQHAAVDVGQPDLAAWRHASHQGPGRVAASARHVEHALAGPRARKLDGKRLPHAVQAERHQVVHQVIALGNAVEYFTHPCCLFGLGYLLIPKVDTFRQSKSLLLVAAGARGLQFGKVLRPKRVLILAQLVQIVPRINAGAVPVGEYRLNRVRADRLEHANLDLAFAGLEHLLPRPVAAHLCRRGVHAQELVRQPEAAAVREADLHHARFLVQLDLDRNVSAGHLGSRFIAEALEIRAPVEDLGERHARRRIGHQLDDAFRLVPARRQHQGRRRIERGHLRERQRREVFFVRRVNAGGTHGDGLRQTGKQPHPGRDIAIPGTHQPAHLAEHEVLRLARAHGNQLTVAEAPARTGAAPHHAQALRALVLELPLLEDEARRIFPLSLLAPADPAERLHLLALFWRQLASLARVAEPLSREGVMNGLHVAGYFRGIGSRVALEARRLRLAPLAEQEHQQLLARGLHAVLAQRQLRRRLALAQQVDAVFQALRQLAGVEVAESDTRPRRRTGYSLRTALAGQVRDEGPAIALVDRVAEHFQLRL